MPSKAADVDSYIAEAAPQRAEALTRIRDLARHTLVGFDDVLAYGMPTYSRDGQGAFGFANQKGHVSLYFLNPAVVEAHAAAVAGQDMGKRCLRFRKPAAINYALVEQLLTATRDAEAPGS